MTSDRTKRRRTREELDSFKMIDYEFEMPDESQFHTYNRNSETPDKSLHVHNVAIKNNTNFIHADSSQSFTSDKDDLNYSSLISIDTSPQKFTSSVLIKHIDLCSEVKSKLAEWAINFNVPHNTLNGLLPILKDIPSLTQMPIDARTILNSNIEKKAVQLITIEPGSYYHFGLSLAIKKHFSNNPICNIDIIQVVIGIDGLPLSKSSSSQFWPILGYMRPFKDSVFLIGLYWGHEKPQDSNEFLKEFVIETKNLLLNGINIDGTIKQIKIDGFCLDTPAKTFVLKTKGHTGFDSCTRCLEEGEYLKNRTCFPYSPNLIKRTHNDYVTRKYEEHHVGNAISILSELPINIIESFGLDYMHLTCLGLMRKLLHLWINNGPLNVRLQSSVSKQLTASLLNLTTHIPCEFSRKPRGINELNRYKATELRQLLIYTGQVIFKKYITADCYKHFMTLNIAMTILLSDNMENYVEYARKLLNYFVRSFEIIYGRHLMSYNVHGLLHISDDYEHFGSLDNISAFPFENYLKSLKKMVRKNDRPLQQIVKRFNEKNQIQGNILKTKKQFPYLKNNHTNGPLLENINGLQYEKLYLKNITVKVGKNADSFILTKTYDIVKVYNIVTLDNTNEIIIIGKRFKIKKAFYDNPISSTIFNIFEVNDLSSYSYWSLDNIIKKVMIIEMDSTKIAIPIIHSLDN